MLQDARFKASLDAKTTVREKRWIIPWRAILLRVTMVFVVVAMIGVGFSVIQWRVLPMISAMQIDAKAGPSELALTPAAATLTSVNTTVEAMAMCSVKGAQLVNLNG